MYRHYGEIEERVDMRGEVALLSRNIKIQGEMSRGCPQANENCDTLPHDSFGGHIKVVWWKECFLINMTKTVLTWSYPGVEETLN